MRAGPSVDLVADYKIDVRMLAVVKFISESSIVLQPPFVDSPHSRPVRVTGRFEKCGQSFLRKLRYSDAPWEQATVSSNLVCSLVCHDFQILILHSNQDEQFECVRKPHDFASILHALTLQLLSALLPFIRFVAQLFQSWVCSLSEENGKIRF